MLAQSLRVYSEFAQINSDGNVTAPADPREILSPALVRNGFTSFQIVVQVPPETQYWLHIGQNPEAAVRVTLYRKSGDKLEPAELPFWANATQVLWLDVWTERDAPVRRIKLEPLLDVNRNWIEYPMEARVMDVVVPDAAVNQTRSREPICTLKDTNRLRQRNLIQDAALATRLPKPDVDRLKQQCGSPSDSPESYFKIRDYLFRMR